MSEFDKTVDDLAEDLKMSELIISKVALAETIQEMEMLLQDMYQNTHKFQPWHKRVVGDSLRTLKMIKRKLDYEQYNRTSN